MEDSYLQTVLCPCTKTTVGEALLLCMTIAQRHSLTWVATIDILKLINILFNKNAVPNTKYKLHKYFPADIDKVQYHMTYPHCTKYLLGKRDSMTDNIVCECGNMINSLESTSYFLEFDVKSQLQVLFSDPNITNSLNNRYSRKKLNVEGLDDICDGEQYKKYIQSNLLRDEYNFSYTFNTDGCQATNSSKVSMWPIYLMINELPLNIRS